MISLEDARWSNMIGGYKMPFDPRPLLKRLETEHDTAKVWHELWEELYHQGDIGDASFAAVPFLVRIYQQRGVIDWNTYAIVAIIELARTEGKNPDLPEWLAEDYFRAIRELAEIGTKEVMQSEAADDIRAMLGVVAIQKGLRTHGRFLVNYSEAEMNDVESRV